MYFEDICYMFMWMSVYSWHSRTDVRIFPVGKIFARRILYIITVLFYWWKMCATVNLSCLPLSLLLSIYQTNKKKVFNYFRSHKYHTNIMAHKSQTQHKSKKILKGVVVNKTSCYPEGNYSKKYTDKNKGQASKTNRYRVKKTWTKTQGP